MEVGEAMEALGAPKEGSSWAEALRCWREGGIEGEKKGRKKEREERKAGWCLQGASGPPLIGPAPRFQPTPDLFQRQLLPLPLQVKSAKYGNEKSIVLGTEDT